MAQKTSLFRGANRSWYLFSQNVLGRKRRDSTERYATRKLGDIFFYPASAFYSLIEIYIKNIH